MAKIEALLHEFWNHAEKENIEIYNEFSLQHELGMFLRQKLPGYKVQFERNISFFGIKAKCVKHEIDIVVYNATGDEKYAIELKYPRNGQYPEQMYAFIKDISFMEELKQNGFTDTFVMTVVEDKNFYSGRYGRNDIYRFFRGGEEINGKIEKPTGHVHESVSVKGSYRINWTEIHDGRMVYILKIQ